MTKNATRYDSIIEKIFTDRYSPSAAEIKFKREDIETTAAALGVKLPKNLGDLLYTFRYRKDLPQKMVATQPTGKEWIIRGDGAGQ